MATEHKKPIASPDQCYEAGEVNAAEVSVFLGLILAIIVGVFIFVTFFYDRFYNILYKERVEEAASVQLDAIREREKSTLTTYGAVDATKGQFRIPLDKAKQLLLSEAEAGKPFYSTKDQAVKAEPGAAPAAAGGAAAPVADATNAPAAAATASK